MARRHQFRLLVVLFGVLIAVVATVRISGRRADSAAVESRSHAYVVVARRGGARQLQLLVIGRGPAKVIATGPVWYPSASSDHAVIAWNDNAGTLWAARPGNSPRRLVVSNGYNEGDAFWSWAPHGHRLVSITRRGAEVIDAADGHRAVVMSAAPHATFSNPRWSPTGSTIAYIRTTTVGRAGCSRIQLGVAPASGGRFRGLVDLYTPGRNDEVSTPLGCGGGRAEEAIANAALVEWSPDGRMLAFSGRSSGDYPAPRFVAVGTGVITDYHGVSPRSWIRWSPLSRKFAFEGPHQQIYLASPGERPRPVRGHAREPEGASIVWSPTGNHLAYPGRGGNIFTVAVDGADERVLTAAHNVVRWWPDQTIALIRNISGGRSELIEIRPDPASTPRVVLRAEVIVTASPAK